MPGAGIMAPAGAEAVAAPHATRVALRAATAAAHERLHHLSPFAALSEGRLDRPGYVALLRRLLGFHAALEAAVAAAPPLATFGIDAAERRRSGLLRQDLDVLGAAAMSEVPRARLPPFDSAAGAMGGLYVTEGATLGGRLLARGLDRLLGPGEAGRAFLLGHGAAHGAMWQGFCAGLECCGADPARFAAMVAGAQDTFAAFEAWFGTPGWMPDAAPPVSKVNTA